MVPFTIEERMVLGLYLGKQGCMFHIKAVQMRFGIVRVGADTTGTGGYYVTNGGGARVVCK